MVETALLMATLRGAVPMICAALGGLFSERSGVVQIALEGFMLVGAFAGAVGAHYFGSPWLGMLVGIAAAMAMGLLFSFLVLLGEGSQVVIGIGMNLLCFGLCPFFSKVLFNNTGATPNLSLENQFGLEPFWICLGLVVITQIVLKRTPMGLWIKFSGEAPEALQSVGISARKVRFFSILTASAFAGLGGVFLSTFLSSHFSRNMTAGRGFMALAALIAGNWRPVPAFAACLVFGFFDSLQSVLQGMRLSSGQAFPVQLIQILPYIATLLIVAGFVGRSRAPRALGRL